MNENELLTRLGNRLGMDLSFDEAGNCLLLIDERYSLCIRKEEDRFILLGDVATELPDPVDYSLVTDLLDFGFAPVLTGGPAIGRDPESGILSAWAFIPTKNLTAEDFIQAVERFLEFQILISERIAGGDLDENPVDERDLEYLNA